MRGEREVQRNQRAQQQLDYWTTLTSYDVNEAHARDRLELLKAQHGHSRLSMARTRTLMIYESNAVQWVIALLICVGFLVDLAEAHFLPAGDSLGEKLFLWIDIALTALFSVGMLFPLAFRLG